MRPVGPALHKSIKVGNRTGFAAVVCGKEGNMERLTEYHGGIAVIRDKNRHKEAMEVLAKYEDTEERKRKAETIMPDVQKGLRK